MMPIDIPIKVQCPLTYMEETVYFIPIQKDGKWYVAFNGCNNNYGSSNKCEACGKLAAEKIPANPFAGPQIYMP